jgi:hypothetical protein
VPVSRSRPALDVLAGCLRGEAVGSSMDWMAVLELANNHLLTPALWSALCESGSAGALPDDARNYLETLYRLNADRNRALRRQAIELMGALNESCITPALLKGGLALFAGPHADPASRMMRDLDILVPVRSRGDAVAVLEGLGYRLFRQYSASHHAFGDFMRPGDPASVDLHTDLVDSSYVLPASEVWSRAEPRESDGVRYFALSATDRVMHNLLHAQIHYLGDFYRGELKLQQVHELAALARTFGPAVDWSLVEWRLRTHRLGTPLESYLLAAHRLFGFEWPLSGSPGLAARAHYRRCRLQLGLPPLRWIGVPWGNLRSAFAWHRMHALYGNAGGPLSWRCRHVFQYLQKIGLGATLLRLLRVE